jgi:hypothetical protein
MQPAEPDLITSGHTYRVYNGFNSTSREEKANEYHVHACS